MKMQKMIKGIVFVGCLGLAACGSESDSENNDAMTNNSGGKSDAPNNDRSSNNTTTPNNNGTSAGNNNGTSTVNNGTTNAGGLALGADCADGDVCNGGFCNPKAGDICDGVCTAYLAIGDACADDEGTCDPNSVCVKFGSGTCEQKVAKGESCAPTLCEDNLFCDRRNGNVCADLLAVGELCQSLTGCEEGSYCDWSDFSAPVCKTQNVELGGECDEATEKACKAPYTCNRATRKCVAPVVCN